MRKDFYAPIVIGITFLAIFVLFFLAHIAAHEAVKDYQCIEWNAKEMSTE